jgi:hypothetical protein
VVVYRYRLQRADRDEKRIFPRLLQSFIIGRGSARASMIAPLGDLSIDDQIMKACRVFIPDKVFLWNPDGKYLRHHYSNPRAKHYAGPEKILGHYIQEVLPAETGDQILSVMRVAWLGHQMQFCTIQLPLEGIEHKVCIRFFPKQHSIIGLVNDFKIPTNPRPIFF